MTPEVVVLAAEVEAALARGHPVVALETAITTHGLPRPANLETALALERAVRDAGAVPATIAVLDGQVRVGLRESELERLATAAHPRKTSTRDLARAVADGAIGGTTVAATIHVARRCGIRFAATGGIGGVHRGGELSLDVSADLFELARSPVTVVCSGPKAILDLARTLEMLESLGVTVVGFGTTDLPGFYVARTGLRIPAVADEAGFVRLWRAHLALGEPTSLVVTQPPPADLALEADEFARLLEAALAEARRSEVAGAEETPFLLAFLARATAGRTVRLNIALATANARLAARLAVACAAGSANPPCG
ncbi:Pseudouridine-5'-phosphate glycosidase [bacterium HR40]|nr:Pseudouridine-5'-phosphate glycosidase [bacterium HR40]